jgi:hypothetical protein
MDDGSSEPAFNGVYTSWPVMARKKPSLAFEPESVSMSTDK